MSSVQVTVAGETVTVAYGSATPTPLWEDNFSSLDSSKWNVRNNDYEKNQYAFNLAANVSLQADGLHLAARRQTGLPGQPSSKPYTSGYIDTIGKFEQRFGLWEIDAKLPTFVGAWPALWLRSDGSLGEIDILESVGGHPTIVQTVHQSTNGDMAKSGYEWSFPAGWDPTALHTYGLRRATDGSLTWMIDGKVTHTRTQSDLDNKGQPMTWLAGAEFSAPLDIRINLQVGGSMPAYYGCDVNAQSALPGDLVIRAVRFYQ